jgi:RimJ/RimL family protein N-acetyltransferase
MPHRSAARGCGGYVLRVDSQERVTSRRLRGERPQPWHASAYALVFGDTDVGESLWPGDLGGPRTREQARGLLAADTGHWKREGFGPWVFFEARMGGFVGRGGLQRTQVGGRSSVEVLYAVRRDVWGRGLATEMALTAVQCACRLGFPEVVGFTLTTNVPSQRVLEKAGLRFERELDHAGFPHWFGRLSLTTHDG